MSNILNLSHNLVDAGFIAAGAVAQKYLDGTLPDTMILAAQGGLLALPSFVSFAEPQPGELNMASVCCIAAAGVGLASAIIDFMNGNFNTGVAVYALMCLIVLVREFPNIKNIGE